MKLHSHQQSQQNRWLALEIGNSRLHWALFIDATLDCTWDTDHLPESVIQQFSESQTLSGGGEVAGDEEVGEDQGVGGDEEVLINNYSPSSPSSPHPPISPSSLPIVLASVVPSQTELWQSNANVRVITLNQIPLKGVYPTLGIDRALALWGAGKTWGFPMLVIDAGTALTFTGADANQFLVGGAILPGLGLQLATLGQNTGQLPLLEVGNCESLPPRFALNTAQAIQSGVIYTLLAGIKDFMTAWWELFPAGNVAIKGGDRTLLLNYLQTLYPEIATRLIVEPNLIFWGMREIVLSAECFLSEC